MCGIALETGLLCGDLYYALSLIVAEVETNDGGKIGQLEEVVAADVVVVDLFRLAVHGERLVGDRADDFGLAHGAGKCGERLVDGETGKVAGSLFLKEKEHVSIVQRHIADIPPYSTVRAKSGKFVCCKLLRISL